MQRENGTEKNDAIVRLEDIILQFDEFFYLKIIDNIYKTNAYRFYLWHVVIHKLRYKKEKISKHMVVAE